MTLAFQTPGMRIAGCGVFFIGQKENAAMGKQCSLHEAAALVGNGARLAISGGLETAPMALVRELVRRNVRGLHLVCSGSVAMNADLLIGAGCVDTVELSHILIGEYGFAPRFRSAAEEGMIRILDHSCPGIAAALQAGALGIPFIPVHGFLGSDYMRVRPDFAVIANPFGGGEEIALVPAIRPDIALFHGYEADTEGNVVTSVLQNNKLLAQAASRTIATVERIVPAGQLDRSKGAFVPARYVACVVESPGGAYPAACPGYYEADREHVRHYVGAAGTKEGFQAYLEEYVLPAPLAGAYAKTDGGDFGE